MERFYRLNVAHSISLGFSSYIRFIIGAVHNLDIYKSPWTLDDTSEALGSYGRVPSKRGLYARNEHLRLPAKARSYKYRETSVLFFTLCL